MEEKKYKENEEFYEITFEIPKENLETQNVADLIFEKFEKACNVKVIPCNIVIDPSRLSVSKDNYSYPIWNSKQKSQIIRS